MGRVTGERRGGADGRRLGLVLGAGGRAGEAFHRGVLRAMEELGLDPRAASVVVGTSAGALAAASLRRASQARPVRMPPPPQRRPAPRRSLLLDLVRRPRQGVNAMLLRPEFMTGRRELTFMIERLRRVHGTTWPAAELWIVAVRRRDGRRVVFGRGGAPAVDVGSAVAASCAVPAYFAPVEIDGVQYIDGGVHSPTNADLLAGCDLDIVVVSAPMSVDLRSAGARVDLPMRLRFRQLLRGETWALERRGMRIVTIEPDGATLRAMGLNMMSASRLGEVEERALAHARLRLRAIVDGGRRGRGGPV